MIYKNETLELLGNDGHGNRLWLSPSTGKVANETFDVETGNPNGLDSEIEGWGYSEEDSLI